jgi:hypothetical protein
VGGGSAEVVSIGVGGMRRPDYSRIACGQVAAARRHLGMDIPDFTRLINDLTGWDAMPETVAAWEDDMIPPADVLLAVTAAAQAAPGVALAMPLLAAPPAPPAFPAETLAGPWVTCYQFTSATGQLRHHADIARITAGPDGLVRAVNHPPEPRSEGRAVPFRNEIDAVLAGRHLVGLWRNTSDTRYYGALDLAVRPGETVIEGWYGGVGSDVEVSTGFWKWVRLAGTDVNPAAVVLRDPASLYELVMSRSQYDAPLALADIGEET